MSDLDGRAGGEFHVRADSRVNQVGSRETEVSIEENFTTQTTRGLNVEAAETVDLEKKEDNLF